MSPETLRIDRVLGVHRHPPECPCICCASVETRLWRNVEKTDGCWNWTGRVNRTGYARISMDGKKMLAHRVSYIIANGPIPDGMLVCHRCDNPRCVNPDHLFLGSQTDNMRDAIAKGRFVPPKNVGWTHCARGHEYTPENTYEYQRRGMTCRNCRECQRLRRRAYAARGRAA